MAIQTEVTKVTDLFIDLFSHGFLFLINNASNIFLFWMWLLNPFPFNE